MIRRLAPFAMKGLIAAAGLLIAGPALAQTVGPCPAGAGSSASVKATWVLFDLGSAVVKPDQKAGIAEAAQSANARQLCGRRESHYRQR